MPNLATELANLALADAHIARAEASLDRLRRQRVGPSGESSFELDAAIAAGCESLEAFRTHRQLIAETIDDICAGRLPST